MNDPNPPTRGWVPPAPAGPGAWDAWGTPPPPGPVGYDAYQPRPRNSTTPIVVGIVVLVLGVLLFAALISFGAGLGTFMESATGPTLTVGQCFNGGRPEAPTGGTPLLGEVDVVDCSVAHDSEVIAAFDYPSTAGADYPGDRILASYAEAECYVQFERYVGISFQSSDYELTYVTPLELNWALNDKSMQCLVHPPGDGMTTGSVRGSRR